MTQRIYRATLQVHDLVNGGTCDVEAYVHAVADCGEALRSAHEGPFEPIETWDDWWLVQEVDWGHCDDCGRRWIARDLRIDDEDTTRLVCGCAW